MKNLYILFLLMLLPMLASAADKVEIDGIYYELSTGETKTATVISGTNKYSGEVVIPETVTYNEETYSVTSIGGMTFLKIGNSMGSISSTGNSAFLGCTGLTSITIPNSVTSIGDGAFCGCTGLTSLTIGNNVSSIGVMAFARCNGLTSVSIPKSVTSIGNFAFYDCNNLASINVETGNIEYDSRDNCNAIIETHSNTLLLGCKNTIIPSNVISIADKAFYNCNGLTSVTIPNGVTSIGEDAFHACSGLTSITIPNSVTSISNLAFHSCSGLTSAIIPNSVTSIGQYPFYWCSGLTSIEVEGGNTKYDSRDNCNAIIETQSNTLISGCKNTIIPNGVTSIGDRAFDGCGLTSVTIPNSVTSIGIYAFWGCGLPSITIPNSVTSIGAMAFKYCNKLTSVTIPNSVTSISNDLFSGCSKLTSVTIPNSVTSIGTCVFEGCIDLKDVYCYAESVPETRASAFTYCNIDNVSLHVPAGSVEAYKSTEPWNQFKEIKAIEDPNEFSLSFMGQTINDGATLLIDAEGWSALGNIYTDPDGNTKNGLFVFVNKGGKVSGSYSLEILSNTLNGDLKWSMGGETYALNEVTKLEKSFSTDDNGIASVKFSAENIPNEGSLDAKLIVTIGEKTKTFYIKINFKKKDSSDLTVSGKVGEPVDLGLSVKWASWNVGAGAPEEYGNHYAWGELEPKTDYSSSTYKFYSNGYTKYGSIDNKYELDETDDVARQKWGKNWRMPTINELKELYEKCSFTRETINGVPVTKVTGPNGNYIYMPGPGNFTGQTLYFKNSVGSYWSRNLETDSYAKDLDFFTGSQSLNGDTRYHGQSVRPVYVEEKTTEAFGKVAEIVDLGLSVKWASWNMGASKVADYGGLYGIGDPTGERTNFSNEGYHRVEGECISGTDYDLATVKWGKQWRIPTIEELKELKEKCTWESGVTIDGVKGVRATGPNGNQIFIPCAGTRQGSNFVDKDYIASVWSGNVGSTYPSGYEDLDLYFSGTISINGNRCYIGQTIRPVYVGDSQQFESKKIINLQNAGSLSSLLTESEASHVLDLKLYGHMDARDFDFIKWHCMKVENVDLSDVIIDEYSGKYGTNEGYDYTYPANEIPLGAFFYWVDSYNHDYAGRPSDEGMPSLKTIKLPDGIKAIRRNAFARAYNLTQINIPEGVESIDYVSFRICTSLPEIALPSTLKNVGSWAFTEVPCLKKVYIMALTPPVSTTDAFEGISDDAILYVPRGTKNLYEVADGWKTFKNIVEMGETAPITIGKTGKASYCGDKSLDFSFSEEVKAYIATGFDKDEGTIWLTRVKDVPAGVPVLIKGEANQTYQVPVTDSENSYYKNMFVGNTTGEKIQIPETDGNLVNYYLSGDGTFKSVNKSANIGNNKCYLQLPGTFKPAETGVTQKVTIKDIGKASYAAPVDLDFTNVEGLKAFTATGYDKSTKTIWLTRVMKVQKGEGVLLKGDAKDYEIPSAAVQSSYMNMFVGNTSGASVQVQEKSEDGTQTNYYLKGDGSFVSVNGFVNIGNNKCYLELPTSMVTVASTRGAEANYLLEEPEIIKMPVFRSIGNDGDGTTGIKDQSSKFNVPSDAYYTLQGQRVEKPGKGLYIKNGKKIVIK